MLGTPTYNIKPLSRTSPYYREHSSAIVKGDRAVALFGKSEIGEIKRFWWDSIKKDNYLWRGGGIVTNRGTFRFCVYMTWWKNGQKNPKKLYNKLIGGSMIEGENVSIYFWKSNNEQQDIFSSSKEEKIRKNPKNPKIPKIRKPQTKLK